MSRSPEGSIDAEVLELFGRDIQKMSSVERSRWIERAFWYWRRLGFPYPKLTLAEVKTEFERLQRVKTQDVLKGREAVASTIGLRLANAFHPQIWSVQVHGRSPLQCFDDDARLRRALLKAPGFWPNRRCWNAQCVRSLLRVFHRARVSNFRPAVARAVIDRFSGPGDLVIDFSAGYGGRLLGLLTHYRKYLGIDPARDQVHGLRRMAAKLRSIGATSHVKIHRACAEDLLPQFASREASLVFSSPPYFDLERYSTEPTQSYLRFPSYALWKRHFLERVIVESHRVLEAGGHLVLNVADANGHPIVSDARHIGKGAFGSDPEIIRLMMPTMPRERAKRFGVAYRWEPILVFRKRSSCIRISI
jgi:SAM-dependent methyltransferase